MKIQTTLLCGLLLSTPVFAAPINNKSSINQQVGYSFGYLMGRSNAESIQDLDLDAFVQGLREASKGQAASLSDEDMARVLTQYKRQAEAKQLLEVKQLADKNAKIGAAFLAENAKKPEVKTTAFAVILAFAPIFISCQTVSLGACIKNVRTHKTTFS